MGRVLAWGALVLALMWSGAVRAHGTFVVNTTDDHDDGACEAAPEGDCTLREAILAANALVNDHPDAPDTVGFDFGPGAQSPFTIVLESPLPAVLEGASFNGGSEPRYIVSTDHVPVVIIDGGGFDHVFQLRSEATLVVALAFTNAAISAIDAEGANYVLIQGCYFGVEPQTGAPLHGSLATPAFGYHAIHVRDTFRPRIGGSTEISRNVFGGAGAEAILVQRSDSLVLEGNFIGVDGTGFEARPNALTEPSAPSVAVLDSSSIDVWDNVISSGFGGGLQLIDVPGASVERNIIGLDAAGRGSLANGATGLSIAGNVAGLAIYDSVVSANEGPGIVCEAATTGPWRMERNLLGVDAAQSDVVPNAGDGVLIESTCTEATVGSDRSRNGNLIAHNEGAGVRSVDGVATIRGNTIFLNQGLAIDTGPAGRNSNDGAPSAPPVDHPDSGELTVEEASLTVRACVSTSATVEVFEALVSETEPVGALRYLGAGVEGAGQDTDPTVGCSDTNEAGFEITLAVEAPVAAVVLTATQDRHTSELSDPIAPPTPVEPSDACTSDTDCTVDAPVCDTVFRRCVSCIDDAGEGELDAGCLPERPQCDGGLDDRRCVEVAGDPSPSPPQQPTPGSSGGCSATPMGESSWTVVMWVLAGLARFRRKRNLPHDIS